MTSFLHSKYKTSDSYHALKTSFLLLAWIREFLSSNFILSSVSRQDWFLYWVKIMGQKQFKMCVLDGRSECVLAVSVRRGSGLHNRELLFVGCWWQIPIREPSAFTQPVCLWPAIGPVSYGALSCSLIPQSLSVCSRLPYTHTHKPTKTQALLYRELWKTLVFFSCLCVLYAHSHLGSTEYTSREYTQWPFYLHSFSAFIAVANI